MSEMTANEKLVWETAKEIGDRRKLSCAQAHRLSMEHKLPLKEIGRICDELKIRITHCQLGCFE